MTCLACGGDAIGGLERDNDESGGTLWSRHAEYD